MQYVTEKGMKKMLDQLHELKYVKRIEASERLKIARALGDLKENGDYKAAREEIAHIDARISSISMMISDSQIIDEKDLNNDIVGMLSKVKVKDHTRDREFEYTIVSQAEADPIENKISSESAIAKGLFGKKVGDHAIISVPIGELDFEILEISS